MRFSKSTSAALATSLPFVVSQTFTDCDPTKKTCKNNLGLNAGAFRSDFVGGSDPGASWSAAAYSTIKYGNQGCEFSIAQEKQAPTLETDFYLFFGRVDVKMKAAPGTGIVSSIVFESDDLDEIDWEFVGGDAAQVQSNFFGKGNTTSYDRGTYIPVSNPQSEMHTYTVDWTSERIQWIIDGETVRTLTYDDPLTVGGHNYPQTPMKVKLGTWCGGCKGQPKGTVQWAGGNTNFDSAPYVMYVESVNIKNYNPADEYEWSDRSGSWQSINIVNGDSTSDPEGSGSPGDATTTVSGTMQSLAPTKSHSVNIVPTGHGHANNGSYTMKTSMGGATQTNPGGNLGGSPTGGVGASGLGATGASSGGVTQQTGNAATSLSVMTSTSLLGMLFSLLFL